MKEEIDTQTVKDNIKNHSIKKQTWRKYQIKGMVITPPIKTKWIKIPFSNSKGEILVCATYLNLKNITDSIISDSTDYIL